MHHEVLESDETVNSNLYCQQLERVNQELIKKGIDSTKIRLLNDNARPHVSIMTTKYQGARLESVTTRAIRPWHGAIWLSLVQVNGAFASQYAVYQHSTCARMGQWLLCRKVHRVLRYRNPKLTRKMQEHNSYTGGILHWLDIFLFLNK